MYAAVRGREFANDLQGFAMDAIQRVDAGKSAVCIEPRLPVKTKTATAGLVVESRWDFEGGVDA